MTLAEILRAVEEGLPVHWQSPGYLVERAHRDGKCVIKCLFTGHCIGLTWADGMTLNGREEDFFVGAGSTLRPPT
jgi:hypothetical protein